MAFISQIKFRFNVQVEAYKHEHIELTAELDEADDATAVFENLKSEARRMLGVDVTQDDVDEARAVLARAKRAGVL
jgi:hypothetical protein